MIIFHNNDNNDDDHHSNNNNYRNDYDNNKNNNKINNNNNDINNQHWFKYFPDVILAHLKFDLYYALIIACWYWKQYCIIVNSIMRTCHIFQLERTTTSQPILLLWHIDWQPGHWSLFIIIAAKDTGSPGRLCVQQVIPGNQDHQIDPVLRNNFESKGTYCWFTNLHWS